jgi:hypothetical protein
MYLDGQPPAMGSSPDIEAFCPVCEGSGRFPRDRAARASWSGLVVVLPFLES